MAKLYPGRLPADILADPKRAAERRMFEILFGLPDSFTVFYSVAWQTRGTNGARDGEADFILAHPDLGVLILEVKGGRIRFEAAQKQWYSTDRVGIEHLIKDPVEQARNSKGAILSKLKELPGWDRRFLTIAYMVVFPDVVVEHTSIRPDIPRALVLDGEDVEYIEEKIRQGFAWFYGEEGNKGILGLDRLRSIEGILGRSFTLQASRGLEIAQDENRIVELTEEQIHLLSFIQRQRRVLIEGCAGSGKTILAMEKARQLAADGFDTLILCFNAPLAEFLRQNVPNDVDVDYFHGLCKRLAKEAGLGYRAYETEDEYYNKILPDMLLEALMDFGAQYDAVIVDEGQDFLSEWWETINELLRDKKDGIFYIFFDSNQNIYRRRDSISQLISVAPFTLTENCRNTLSIHQVVKKFHSHPESLLSRAPAGHVPEVFYFETEHTQEEQVKRLLHRLVNEEHVDAQYITLLTTRSPEKTTFLPGKKLGNFVLTEWGDKNWRKTDIRVSSAHRFKGLENRVVILTGLEDNDPSWLHPLLYVACSRARTHLILVAHERARSQIEAIFHEANHEIR